MGTAHAGTGPAAGVLSQCSAGHAGRAGIEKPVADPGGPAGCADPQQLRAHSRLAERSDAERGTRDQPWCLGHSAGRTCEPRHRSAGRPSARAMGRRHFAGDDRGQSADRSQDGACRGAGAAHCAIDAAAGATQAGTERRRGTGAAARAVAPARAAVEPGARSRPWSACQGQGAAEPGQYPAGAGAVPPCRGSGPRRERAGIGRHLRSARTDAAQGRRLAA